MIYITGDTHGEIGRFYELNSKYGEGHWTDKDTLIVCGDFGYLFSNDKTENAFLDELEQRPYSICFVDGNHECFDAIRKCPTVEWHGGKVHQIRKNIFHLMRGQIFEINSKSFFAMGGAYSVDKDSRIPGYTWWQDELPSEEEYEEAKRNLHKHGMKVDYIITHTIPVEMTAYLGKAPDSHDSELMEFLGWVMHEVEYTYWYSGHWHVDKDLTDKFSVLRYNVKTLRTY